MLSIPHLIVIFVVALVVFGPEKLPELARNFGKVMAEFRRATGDLRSTFEGHMRDLEREAETRRIAPAPAATATNAPAPPAATGPQPVPTAAPRAVPSPDGPQPPDPPLGQANAAAVDAGVMDPMQDPFLAGYDFDVPRYSETPPSPAGGSAAEKAPEPAEKSPENVSPK
ncbi:MAG TPA: twin-arginine translocase TatA/TatE family subunit [Candidatus Baltobacteraceae bacterium]|nr:twin-arginine translocase TatA/TatE family subunit [Candidatus Baltobacteraceae bacterium]